MSTPIGMKAMGMATPTPGHLMNMTPEQVQAFRFEKEMDDRNRYAVIFLFETHDGISFV